MPSVKVALPGSRVPIGRTASGELIYPTNDYWKFFQAMHLRSGGDAVDKVEAAASVGETASAAADAANTAAATANAAAVTAQTAASTAQTAADSAQSVADGAATDVASVQTLSALQLSGVSSGTAITGSDTGSAAQVAVNAHTRHYGDGTSVSVNSGSVGSLSYDTVYHLYYDDASRAGGAVTYAVTTNSGLAQPTPSLPDRHYVGSVRTPLATDPNTDGDPNFYAP